MMAAFAKQFKVIRSNLPFQTMARAKLIILHFWSGFWACFLHLFAPYFITQILRSVSSGNQKAAKFSSEVTG
jgi:hypothetical protein